MAGRPRRYNIKEAYKIYEEKYDKLANQQKKRGQSLRLRFPGIGKHPSYFERVMCPRYAQASIFTLAVFFYLAISENKIEKRTLFLYVVCTFICPLAYLF